MLQGYHSAIFLISFVIMIFVLNGVSLTADGGPTLNAGYIFMIFQGGSGPPPSPPPHSGSAHDMH